MNSPTEAIAAARAGSGSEGVSPICKTVKRDSRIGSNRLPKTNIFPGKKPFYSSDFTNPTPALSAKDAVPKDTSNPSTNPRRCSTNRLMRL
jgi:hypothetical protein